MTSPGRDEEVAAQWDKLADPAALDPRRISFGAIFYNVFERTLRHHLDALPPARVALDVGCGSGRDLVHLVRGGRAERALGIDISAGAVHGASRLRDELGIDADRLVFRQGRFEELPEGTDADLVLSIGSLNYTSDLASFFLRTRTAAPTATLFVSEHQRDLPSVVRRVRNRARLLLRQPPSAPNHLTFHRAAEVMAAARSSGYDVVSARYAGFGVNWLSADLLYVLWRHRFRRRWTRRSADLAYRSVARLAAVEDRCLRRSALGRYYFLVLRPRSMTSR